MEKASQVIRTRTDHLMNIVLGQMNIDMEEDKIRPLFYATYKNKFIYK